MPDSTDVPSNAKGMDDKKTLTNKPKKTQSDDTVKAATPTAFLPKAVKEQEPAQEKTEVFGKIQEISKEADLAAERKIREAIGEGARLAHREPEIGPDLEDHGVKSPDKEASEVLTKGSVIELPLTEEEYQLAKKAKLAAHVDGKNNVLGVGSVIALAMWVGRILKMAHNHAMRIVFRKVGDKSV